MNQDSLLKKIEMETAVSQNGLKRTFSPHIPAGILPISELKALLATLEEEGVEKVKLGGETVFVWPEGESAPPDIEQIVGFTGNNFAFGGVRPVRMCSAETFCKRNQNSVLQLALKLDKLYYGRTLETKVMIGVAGCQRSCSEPATKDIGIIGRPNGYDMLVGGNAGMKPKIAQKFHTAKSEQEVIDIVGKAIDYADIHCKKLLRLGAAIEKRGMDDFLDFVLERL